MPPEVYNHVKARCHRALVELFVCVASPIDGPAKTTYGDVDILVTWHRKEIFGISPELPNSGSYTNETDPRSLVHDISKVLGAIRTISENHGHAHYAIPWPQEFQDIGEKDGDRPRFIQIDVAISPSLHALQWILFRHAHGDLWNILGSMIRGCGLVVDETALSIRIPEIENINRNRAKIKITDDPVEVLKVLGLDVNGFRDQPFESLDDLYEYAATSPMFYVRPLPPETAESAEGDSLAAAQTSATEQAIMEDKKVLRSNDRRRMRGRPCYRNWVEDFIPRCRAEGRFLKQRRTRESVRAEIFAKFPIKAEYDQRLKDFLIERQRHELWNKEIKEHLLAEYGPNVDPAYRGNMLSAMKKIVLDGDESFGIVPPWPLRDPEGYYDIERARQFIREHHKEVGDAAITINHQKYLQALEKKKKQQEVDAREERDVQNDGGTSQKL